MTWGSDGRPTTWSNKSDSQINDRGKSGFTRREALRHGTLLGAGLVVGSASFTMPARAATITVPGDEPTIQDAVDAASDGDTINVAGSYSSGTAEVLIEDTQDLTIVGDPGGSSPGPGSNPPQVDEFELRDPGPSGTTIKGFELDGSEGIDIAVGGDNSLSNITITDNLLSDSEIDIELGDSSSFNNVDIRRNSLQNSDSDLEFDGEADITVSGFEYVNNLVENGSNDLLDIDFDDSLGGYDVEMLISCNTILNAGDDGIEFELDDGSSSVYDITVYNNVIDGADNEGIEFLDNGGPSLTATITYNQITNCDNGVDIRGDGDGSGITIENNNIFGNNKGLEYDDSETLDARNNYWGASDGPSGGVTDPVTGATATGSGDEIDAPDSVRFDPFLSSAVTRPSRCRPSPFQEPILALGREIGPPQNCDGDGLFEDVNGDGRVDARDQQALNVILSSHTRAKRLGLDPGEDNGVVQRLTDAQKQAFDFNGDDMFDSRDVLALGRQINRGTACDGPDQT